MKPSKSILDKSFRYTNAAETNIRKTFKRARAEMAKVKPVGPVVLLSLMPKNRREA